MTSNWTLNPGTKVVCTESAPKFGLRRNHIYTIKSHTPGQPGECGYVKVEEVEGTWRSNRFRLAGVGEIATAQSFEPERCDHSFCGQKTCADCYPQGAKDRGAPLARLSPPDTNPKTRFGMAKPPLGLIPGSARVVLSQAFADGVAKYGPANWRVDPVSASTYINAAERHLTSWYDGEEAAQDSGVHHLAHAAACLLILIDAQMNGTLNDDRPPKAVTADLIKSLTKKVA